MKELRLEFPEDLGPVKIDLQIKIGDTVKPGDPLAIVGTDKAELELDADRSFILRETRHTDRGLVLLIDEV